MTDRNDATVAEFAKNSREVIRVAVSQFKGHDLVHVRVWVPKDDGALIPTKAGITFRRDVLDQMIEALQLAKAAGGAP